MALFTVTSTADAGTGSLRDAVARANADMDADTIVFAPSLSGRTITLKTGALELSSDIAIDGDADDDGTPDITIDGNDPAVPGHADASRIFVVSAGVSVLDGLTLTGGRGQETVFGRVLDVDGGAVSVETGAELTIENSVLTGNHGWHGGAVSNDGTLVLRNTEVSGNTSTYSGGGIFNDGSLTVIDSTVSGNATQESGGNGGGVFNRGSASFLRTQIDGNSATAAGGGIGGHGDIALDESSVSNNRSQSSGGGIEGHGTITLTGSTVSRNESGGFGGGVNVGSGSFSMTNSSVVDNVAGSDGGGINLRGDEQSATIVGSTIAGNAADRGAAILSAQATLDIANATIAGNMGYSGFDGAIVITSGKVHVTNTTITGNDGYGVVNNGELRLDNSIVSGNLNGVEYLHGPRTYFDGTIVSGNAGTNIRKADSFPVKGLVFTSAGPEDIFAGIDPLTGGGLLADNGGPVRTVALKAGASNPALDSGDPTLAPATDARDVARWKSVDVGAFEFSPAHFPIDPDTADPDIFMPWIRDYDGNDLGGGRNWERLGSVDIDGDGSAETVLVNATIGRWAAVGRTDDGLVDFTDHGENGDTRVVGIYIDPLVTSGDVVAGGPFDSQRRFQNDLFIDNIGAILGGDDYDGDGFQELYFALDDGTAYLHAYMHADGNIRYANYQSEAQVIDYMDANGIDAGVYADWFMG